MYARRFVASYTGATDDKTPALASRVSLHRILAGRHDLVVTIVAHPFDAPHEIVFAAFIFGVLSGVVEWAVGRRG